ncbi:hypothetical protein JIP62_11520 [Brevundimonas vitis]|uniref:Uncharacterized protein n=1 Tax=Brevundimonas vitisensis TaxID=2800818 RepID=A0ABX7BK74_9CAUL|nr:hypothetical protein [Brevundimonas vitisensis]QQQ17947.1 hypothetical protein JIP62_11520 [Brevundimonas vitisensis]
MTIHGPAGDPRPYFEFAAVTFAVCCLFAVFAVIDASDGQTRMGRRSMVTLEDNPKGFRGALIANYGLYTVGALVGSVVGTVGGLAIQATNRSSMP